MRRVEARGLCGLERGSCGGERRVPLGWERDERLKMCVIGGLCQDEDPHLVVGKT
jgi:hypothetical protein